MMETLAAAGQAERRGVAFPLLPGTNLAHAPSSTSPPFPEGTTKTHTHILHTPSSRLHRLAPARPRPIRPDSAHGAASILAVSLTHHQSSPSINFRLFCGRYEDSRSCVVHASQRPDPRLCAAHRRQHLCRARRSPSARLIPGRSQVRRPLGDTDSSCSWPSALALRAARHNTCDSFFGPCIILGKHALAFAPQFALDAASNVFDDAAVRLQAQPAFCSCVAAHGRHARPKPFHASSSGHLWTFLRCLLISPAAAAVARLCRILQHGRREFSSDDSHGASQYSACLWRTSPSSHSDDGFGAHDDVPAAFSERAVAWWSNCRLALSPRLPSAAHGLQACAFGIPSFE
eukprot:m.632418 g.632418  ORF g.632418 m.632418 type:complete len:346 (+) comp58293_c0_seq3:584-1621(+)